MASESLPAALRDFIARYLRSVEQLEILLLIRSRPEAAWTVQEVYDVILSSKPSIERWLEEFVRSGFATSGETPRTWRYAAKGEQAEQVEVLDSLYKLMPVRVIEAIFRRGDPLQSFANAFKFKKSSD